MQAWIGSCLWFWCQVSRSPLLGSLHALELLGFLFAAWQVSLITVLRVLFWSFAWNFDRQLCSRMAWWALICLKMQTVSRWLLIHAGMWAPSLSLQTYSMFYAGYTFIQSLSRECSMVLPHHLKAFWDDNIPLTNQKWFPRAGDLIREFARTCLGITLSMQKCYRQQYKHFL